MKKQYVQIDVEALEKILKDRGITKQYQTGLF